MAGLGCAMLAATLPMPTIAQTSAPEALAQQLAGGFDNPVTMDKLSAYRGGSDVVNNDMKLAGTTADNTAFNVTTGTNTISAGSFANMTGLPVVIQNSGANVLIQNALILNLRLN
ncbi:MAG: hypothetical protein KGL90_12725 [Burkholderiales bacterium]|nr:hypothetical protein [Burkholderiales bacterium]